MCTCSKAEAEAKLSPFCRQHFLMHFLERKFLNLGYNFTDVCPKGFNQQYPRTGSENGLAPTR